MNYALARDHIKSGDLLAWSHRGLSSLYDAQIQFVRAVTRSEFSHVGVAWNIGGRLMVIESVSAGVRIFPLSRLTPFYWAPLPTAVWTPEVEEFSLARLGEEYSKWECIKSIYRPLKNNGQWQCAKWTLAVLAQAGVDLGTVAIPSALIREAMDRFDSHLVLVKCDLPVG